MGPGDDGWGCGASVDLLVVKALRSSRFPLGIEPQTVGIEPQTVGIEPQPVGIESQTVGIEAQPVGSEAQTAGIEAQPVGIEAQPVGIEPQLGAAAKRWRVPSRSTPVRPRIAHQAWSAVNQA
ncbi:MAG TPA: hypothetical protein VH988_01565 [Thermoanaerobaculia bacterium]|nr:hypothetical protein [Thermoanaerobaculia bacterium]